MGIRSNDLPEEVRAKLGLAAGRRRAGGDAAVTRGPGRMNRTEAAYAERLELLRRAGEIAWYGFECMKLRLANRTWYTPDFVVIVPRGSVVQQPTYLSRIIESRFELHEVKGHWEEDARVKVKVVAEQYPWLRVIAVKKDGKGWAIEHIPAGEMPVQPKRR